MVSQLKTKTLDDSRGRILRAAEEEFAARGFDGAKVDRIARRAAREQGDALLPLREQGRALSRHPDDALHGHGRRRRRGAPTPAATPEDQVRRFVRAVAGAAATRPHFPAHLAPGDGRRRPPPDARRRRPSPRHRRHPRGDPRRGRAAPARFRAVNPFVVQMGIVAPLLLFTASAPIRASVPACASRARHECRRGRPWSITSRRRRSPDSTLRPRAHHALRPGERGHDPTDRHFHARPLSLMAGAGCRGTAVRRRPARERLRRGDRGAHRVEVAGRVERVLVAEGARVEAGAALPRLRRRTSTSRLNRARAERAQAEARPPPARRRRAHRGHRAGARRRRRRPTAEVGGVRERARRGAHRRSAIRSTRSEPRRLGEAARRCA